MINHSFTGRIGGCLFWFFLKSSMILLMLAPLANSCSRFHLNFKKLGLILILNQWRCRLQLKNISKSPVSASKKNTEHIDSSKKIHLLLEFTLGLMIQLNSHVSQRSHRKKRGRERKNIWKTDGHISSFSSVNG